MGADYLINFLFCIDIFYDDEETEEDYEDDDVNDDVSDDRADELACPFCFEDFDVLGLCCHIDSEHRMDVKHGVIFTVFILGQDDNVLPNCVIQLLRRTSK